MKTLDRRLQQLCTKQNHVIKIKRLFQLIDCSLPRLGGYCKISKQHNLCWNPTVIGDNKKLGPYNAFEKQILGFCLPR